MREAQQIKALFQGQMFKQSILLSEIVDGLFLERSSLVMEMFPHSHLSLNPMKLSAILETS